MSVVTHSSAHRAIAVACRGKCLTWLDSLPCVYNRIYLMTLKGINSTLLHEKNKLQAVDIMHSRFYVEFGLLEQGSG